jgi:katanin p60 ATPase-containing subunit A1
MDLVTIVQEFEAFYEIKFGRKPRLVRQKEDGAGGEEHGHMGRKGADNSRGKARKSSSTLSSAKSSASLGPASPAAGEGGAAAGQLNGAGNSCSLPELSVKGCAATAPAPPGTSSSTGGAEEEGWGEEGLGRHVSLRSLPPGVAEDPELRILAGAISREILQRSPRVSWDDIVGLEGAKRLLREAVVMPVRFPQVFRGPLLAPWAGILLYGPPGRHLKFKGSRSKDVGERT